MDNDGFLLSLELLTKLRERANREAQIYIRRHILARRTNTEGINSTLSSMDSPIPSAPIFPIMSVQSYACSVTHTKEDTTKVFSNVDENENSILINHVPNDIDDIDFLTPVEEQALIRFYCSKIFSLIGPHAQISRLQKDSKVASTAAILVRRFFLSNSVMMYDPKAIMVAAVFLASKVEDATVDIRLLEEGTQAMNAPVSISDILNAEIQLIEGVNFELLYFHPYNSVMAFTEDLRTFLKSEIGSTLISFINTTDENNPDHHDHHRILTGDDLRPMHDEARRIIDDAVVSDVPLLASPGQIGLASLMVANETLLEAKQSQASIQFHKYIQHRFASDRKDHDIVNLLTQIDHVCSMLRLLKDGKFGCGNHAEDLEELKKIHKKLKACRAWGGGPSIEGGKKKKRKRDEPRG